jgi:uncharacterized protein YkwD
MPNLMVLGHRQITVVALVAFALAALALILGPTPPVASASACSEWGDAKPDSIAPGDARKAIVCLLNVERQKAGVRPLESNKKLQRAAQRHSDEMDGSGCFDHECPGESALGDRLEIVDYLVGGLTRWVAGENIAWGYDKLGTPKAIVNAWMNSPPHRSTLLNGSFHDVGIGFAVGTPRDGGDPGGIYTADFGLRVG